MNPLAAGPCLNDQIDLVRFRKSTRSLKWLPRVGSAFLGQLPAWREDFDTALAHQDRVMQAALLHKLKGSYYAVAAYKAVHVLIEVEALLESGAPLPCAALLSQLALVEAELQAIVASPDWAALS